MQELPELDIYRALLAERFAGALLTDITINMNGWLESEADQFKKDVIGQSVWFVERRAQHLIFHLDNGKRLLVYISNQAYAYCAVLGESVDASASAVFHFGDRALSLFGLKAGDLSIMSVKGVEAYLKDSGYDPLDKRLTLHRFMERFAKKRSSLKTALMDDRLLSGIGAIYSDEIAYAAGIRPEVKVSSLDKSSWERLYSAMGSVLREAILHGGVGEKASFAGDIFTGGYVERLQVYNREGEACRRCDGVIQKISVGNRKAFVCCSCQEEQ